MSTNELELRVEELMDLIHNHYEANTYYQGNEGVIKILLYNYVDHNGDCERLKNFLDNTRNIHYLQDKNILYFIEALVNTNNDYDITLEQELACFDVLLDTSKNYMDSSRGKTNLYDNPLISELVDLYVNYGSELDPLVKKLFIIFINNNYDLISSYCAEYDDVIVLVRNFYQDFIRDEYFKNYNFYNSGREERINNYQAIYEDISQYLQEQLLDTDNAKRFK